ncbi:MAG: hypothetical protein JXB32_06125 [Deltaproteobacteria bacterium]|nr:hypothetical protein [Deltaproteobacteria bacterium]
MGTTGRGAWVRHALLARAMPLLAAAAAACGPSAAEPAPVQPAAEHRAVLLRPGGLFLQLRLDRVRRRLPAAGEVATLAWTPTMPGAACLIELLWSADLASAWFATTADLSAPASGAALIDGVGVPAERVDGWADCVLAGLGSGAVRRSVDGPESGDRPPQPPLEFVVGTGRWGDTGIAALGTARWGIVSGEPFAAWAWELAGRAPPPAAGDAGPADRVVDADVQLVWLDAEALSRLLVELTAGLGPVPPAEDLRGLAAGLWVGERPRVEAWFEARGPTSAAAITDTLRTAATMLQLGVSVQAAQLGVAFGAEIQERAEQVAAIAERAVFETRETLSGVRLELTADDLARVQGFALALASRGLAD